MADDSRRTFLDYKNDVLHALGNPEADTMRITPAQMVNDALEHIATIHEWNWLSTGEIQLDLVADKDYIVLPADFGTMYAIEHTNAWVNRMVPVTWQQLLAARRQPITGWTAGYLYVVNTGNVEEGQEDAGLSLPTLNLWPTPSTSETGAIRMVYRRFLRRLLSPGDRPAWPAYMDRLLSLLSREFAATDYDDIEQAAAGEQFSRMLADCKSKDGLSVKSFGKVRGAVNVTARAVPWGYPAQGIPDPPPGV